MTTLYDKIFVFGGCAFILGTLIWLLIIEYKRNKNES